MLQLLYFGYFCFQEDGFETLFEHGVTIKLPGTLE